MIHMPYDPIEKIKKTIERAGDEFANAAVLATVGRDQQPSARMLLVKQIDEDGLVFYTNLNSRKARELDTNSRASLCFWWPGLQIQVRVEGCVELIEDSRADEYFASRPRGSQIGAWASRQSAELAGRDALKKAFTDVSRQFHDKDVPRPPHWAGYRLVPRIIEFWYGREDRLHERQLFERHESGWKMKYLYP